MKKKNEILELIKMKGDKPKLYTYCNPYDDGAAPNPFWGVCTLVICKPVIRRNAKKGDWVVGIGSKNSPIGDKSKHVVYAMKITDKMSLEKYDTFSKKNYPNKIPDWYSTDYRRRVGDCIYDYSEGKIPKIRKGIHNESNMEKDLKGKFALISKHFYYFGDHPEKLPYELQRIIKKGPGHKSDSNDPHVDDFISWIEGKEFEPNKIHGEPQGKKRLQEDPEYLSKCSEYHHKEAEADEEIYKKCR